MDRGLLNRATEGTDAPTPGYLYLDIAKNAASSPVTCQEIATFLTRRLQSKKNHNIKYKCLKVIAKTSESPVTRGQFKRVMCQDPSAVAAVKEALNFRGPPDPARGDEIYERVRTAAKEALDAIYSDTPTSSSAGYGQSATGGVSSSYGSSPYVGGSGGGMAASAGGPRKMEGIGNPRYKDPRLEQPQGPDLQNMTIGDLAKEAGSTIVGMIRDPLAKNVEVPSQGHSTGSYGGPGGAPPGRSQMVQATGGQWSMASNRGPNAIGSSGDPNASASPDYYKTRDASGQSLQWAQQSGGGGGGAPGGVGGSWGGVATAVPIGGGEGVASRSRAAAHGSSDPSQPYVGITPSVATNASGSGGTAVSDGTYEKQLIQELCPPGGMKPEPPPDKLRRFAQAVPSLNPDLVCPALLDSLEDGNPWIIRAKALCVIETSIKCGNKGNINPYADFFYTCRGEIEPLAGHARAAIKEPAKRVLALLGLDATDAPVPSAPAAVAPNLLDFDDDQPAALPQAPPETPPAAPPAGEGDGGLFGGLNVQQTAPAAPPPAPPASTPTAPAPKGDSLLDMGVASPAPASNGGLFDSMNVKSPDAPSPIETVAAAGSSFSFMNAADAPPASPATSKPVNKETFDPLLNVPANASPNTMKKMQMNLTPAQLQAMYQQQQMAMMQQQMQQMQMAMAMQQQPSMRPPTPRQGSNPNIMQANSNFSASTSFSFIDDPSAPKKKDDKSFDFVKETMKKG